MKWKRGCRFSNWWSTRWGSQLSSSRSGRSLITINACNSLKRVLLSQEFWGQNSLQNCTRLFSGSYSRNALFGAGGWVILSIEDISCFVCWERQTTENALYYPLVVTTKPTGEIRGKITETLWRAGEVTFTVIGYGERLRGKEVLRGFGISERVSERPRGDLRGHLVLVNRSQNAPLRGLPTPLRAPINTVHVAWQGCYRDTWPSRACSEILRKLLLYAFSAP